MSNHNNTSSKRSRFPSKMPSTIFIDTGGVINDNERRGPQWLQYMGEFFPTTSLGGTADIWCSAHSEVVEPFFRQWHDFMTMATHMAEEAQAKAIASGKDPKMVAQGLDPESNVANIFDQLYQLILIQQVCNVAAPHIPGLTSKLSEEELFQLAKRAHAHAMERVKADYPGAVETIQALKATGLYKLYTSSGDHSRDIECNLKGLGILDCFEEVYGVDRVNCLKLSRRYFERVFDRVGLKVVKRDDDDDDDDEEEEDDEESSSRDEVVVLDDCINTLQWARELGARTVLIAQEDVDLTLEEHQHIDYHLRTLSELPALLETWRTNLGRP
ncbi:hypothetical protein BGZ65_012171 [Modicella reniformis]|uniref:HAD-like protein n=1 Tax=Modicella reniformis TaxID=1440133 RepID=A0A9P6SV00_9FUNG|nr:hypothetical protein BGZ65_012171 [Modicella reniformis]